MQFMLAIYEDDAVYAVGERGEAWQAIIAAHTKLGEEMAQAGIIRGGEGLQRSHTATTVKVQGGQRSVHDGPYAETREQLGGFYVIEVASLDEAIAWARKIPVTGDGAVEIRPCLQAPAG